ncbi:GIY-YIG nuclease family protein [Patescibacteria group bacterium]|nr:GIY-YIG nuclease family protein [Patescibacteria group bacterium]
MYNHDFYVYIMTNYTNTVLYTGVTNNLLGRVIQHRAKIHEKSFTAKYNVKKLVYYERFDNPVDAITREKQIKGWLRSRKIVLIKSVNPKFKDLYNEI